MRPKGEEKIITLDDGFEYCETGERKMDNKDQGGIKKSNKKPLRIKKMITVEDGSAICKKGWKQIAMCDPDNTRQTSNASPPRRIKDSICITDPEQSKGEGGSYEQSKENQSRKQYSLRSKAKEQKEESDIGSSAISSMSSRNSTSAMETNEISVCAKPVSPDMKAPTEQTGNQHGDQAVNNYMGSISDQSINNNMGSIGDQAVNNYMGSIGDQAVNNCMGSSSDQTVNDYMGSVGGQSVNDYKGSTYNQVHNGSNFMGSCRDQADNQYRNISSNTGTRSYKRCNNGYKNGYNRQHQQHGEETTNFLDFQHTTTPRIVHAPNIFLFSGSQCATMIPLYR